MPTRKSKKKTVSPPKAWVVVPIRQPGRGRTLERFAEDVQNTLNDLEDRGYQTPGLSKISETGFIIIGRISRPMVPPGMVMMGFAPGQRPEGPVECESEHTEELLGIVFNAARGLHPSKEIEAVKEVVGGLKASSEEMLKIANDCEKLIEEHDDVHPNDTEDCVTTRLLTLVKQSLHERIGLQVN